MREKPPTSSAAPDNDKLLVTVDEAAHLLSIGRSHLYEYLLRGTLRSVQIGRSRRIASSDLQAFIDRLLQDSADTSPAAVTPSQIRPVKKGPEQPRRR